eukprot:TRINITY_DN1832_c0_g1_i1.p1 TRINITY_DN1832_c0_g1~~TRINITY_DN1832_c0_g1_i1.p1  ORF type:complete len:2470 (-),score=665.52 TRINITY_DN1832_c0_g1_i1:45-7454(-)
MTTNAAILSLKVFIQKTGATKTIRLAGDMSVHEAIKEIQGKEAADMGLRDHGLFLPPNKETGKKGSWLDPSKSLRFYGIVTGMTLEFKKKHRPLRIKLRDETTKMVVIDDSLSVREISDMIGEKIGLKNSASEYCLRKPDQPGMSKAPAWLVETQTLHEQDITEEEELVYAKRLFFSDDNIDKDDPFSLHLLYVESLKAIIDGKYPVTRNDAKDFAAIQMQITYGDHDPSKHKPGFLDPNLFLPLLYRKDKKIQAEIFRDHKKLVGMSDMNAKYRYCQLVRSLKSYGITFFDCREKQTKGKQKNDKKSDRILIGVTKEKILKVDPETQRTIKEWTFEQMRRWSFAHGFFTLDFGDYEDDYITVITEEGEALAQLIASYIDQILKTRVDIDRVVKDDADDVAEAEMMEGEFGIATAGMVAGFSYPYGGGAGMNGAMGPGQNVGRQIPGQPGGPLGSSQGYPPGFNAAQHALPPSSRVNVVDMGSAVKCTKLLATELGQGNMKFGMPGQLSAEEWQKQFNTHKGNIDKAVGEILASAKLSPGTLNRNQLDQKAKQIALDMKGMAAAARNLSEIDDENIPLLDGTKATAGSIGDLFELMMKAVDEPNNPLLRAQLDAAEKMFAGAALLSVDPKLAIYADKGAELLMVECINDIDNNLDLVMKTVAAACASLPPPAAKLIKDELEKLKTIEGFTMHSLKDLLPRVLEQTVQRHMAGAGDSLEKQYLDFCAKVTAAGLPASCLPVLDACKEAIHAALMNLDASAKTAEERGMQGNLDINAPTRDLLQTLASVRTALDDPQQLVPALKELSDNQQKVIQVAKTLAEGADPQTKERLMNAAKNLHAGSKMLLTDAAMLAKTPNDLTLANKVVADIGRVEGQCQELLVDAGSLTALNNLRYNAKAAGAGLMKLASLSSICGPSVTDRNARAELLASAKGVQSGLAGLLNALQGASADPQNFAKQSDLLQAVNATLPQSSTLTGVAKKAARFVEDPNKKQELTYAANDSADFLKNLMNSVRDVSDLGGQTEIEDALAEFDSVKATLETAELFAHQGLLVPIPGQTKEGAQELLKMSTASLAQSIKSLTAASKTGGKLPEHVRSAASAMGQVATAAETMAKTITDRPTQKRIIGAAKQLADNTISMVAVGRSLAAEPSNMQKVQALDQATKQLNSIVAELLAEGSGLEAKDINKAIEDVQKEKAKLTKDAPSRAGFKENTDGLQSAAKALNAAVSQLVATAKTNPIQLGTFAKVTGATTSQLMQICSNTASSAPDGATADSILASARALADAMAKLFQTARVAATTKTPESLAALQNTQDAIAKNVNDLLNSLGTGASPEADQAIQRIMAVIESLDSGKLEVSAGRREDLLNEFLSCAKDLTRVAGSLASSANTSTGKVGMFSKEAASTIKTLVETAKAASQSDGAAMSLNGSRIIKGTDYIIENPEDTKRVVGIAKKVTQAASELINEAKEYARTETDQRKRNMVVANAQEVVKSATALANATKVAANTPQQIQQLVATARSLKNCTSSLEEAMASSNPDANKEEAIDPKIAQQLLTTSRIIAVEAAGLIRGANAVAANPDTGSSDDLKKNVQTLSESIKQLVNLTGHLNPGVQECVKTTQIIQAASGELDKANIEVTTFGNVQNVAPASNLQTAQNATGTICKQAADNLKTLVNAVGNSKSVVTASQTLQKTLPTLVAAVKTTVATTSEPAQKNKLLGNSKAVLDSFAAVIKAIQVADVNDKQSTAIVAAKANETSAAIGILLGDLQSVAQLQGELDRITKSITASVMEIKKPVMAKSYQEGRDGLTSTAKELAGVLTTLVNTDKRNTGQVGIAANLAATTVATLVENTGACIQATPDQGAKKELEVQVKLTGDQVVKLLAAVKATAAGDDKQIPVMRQAFNDANTSLSSLLAAAKKGAVGELAMDKAIEGINTVIAKLNTQSIFAQAGQLEVDRAAQSQTMQSLQQSLQDASQKLATTAISLQKATRSGDEELGTVCTALSTAVANVANAAEKTASRMPDSVSQQDVLSSAKSLAIASHQLILAGKDAQRLPNDHAAQNSLAASIKGVGESANNLLAAVQRAGAEAERGERELEAKKQQIMALLKNVQPAKATAEDCVISAREVLKATADLVFANDQGAIITAGNSAYVSLEKLLTNSAGASKLSPDVNIQRGVTTTAAQVAKTMVDLLEVGKLSRSEEANLPKLEAASTKVTTATNALVEALRKLPNAQDLSLDEKGDLDKIAEEELLKCANIIKDAAKALEMAKPQRKTPKIPGVLDKIDIDTAIVDAAKAIATATGILVQHAYTAQRERMEKKRIPGNQARYRNDPTWANGLISASHGVAETVQSLVKAANKAATGQADEEELVATARGVAASTAHLVSASRAKADPNSSAHKSLSDAAKAVATATSGLVAAAAKAGHLAEEAAQEEVVSFNVGGAAGKAKELESQIKILKLEKELEKERQRMLDMRKGGPKK